MWYHLYVASKKMIQINLFTKPKETHTHTQKTNLWLPKEREIRTLRLADTHRILYINRQKIVKQQGPTVWHSNCNATSCKEV